MSEELEQELLWVVNHEEVVSTPLKREEIIEIYKEIERLTELCNKYEEEHKNAYEIWKKAINVIAEIREYVGLSEEERKYLSIYDVNGIGILEIIDKLGDNNE